MRLGVSFEVTSGADAYPELGGRPQELVNRQLLEQSDLLIAVFWTRLGSDTGTHTSGTVEELERHLDARKPALVYFSNAPIAPDKTDDQQYGNLKSFRASLERRGFVKTFDSVRQFEHVLRRNFEQVIGKLISAEPHSDKLLYDQLRSLGVRDVIEKAANHLSQISEIRDVIFDTAARRRLNDAIHQLAYISQGTVPIDTASDLIIVPTELSQRMRSLLATTLWSAGDPAQTTMRGRLREIQREAISQRGAAVKRLFVVDQEEQNSQTLETRMREDLDCGVDVRWILSADWVRDRRALAPIDFGVWDDELVWLYVETVDDTNRRWRAELIREHPRVESFRSIFFANWELARSIKEL